MRDKIISYIGFAIKASKIKMGVNAILSPRGDIHLLIMCDTAAKNTVKEAVKIAQKCGTDIIVCKGDTLENILNKENCKLAAILDSSLANAIKDNLNDKFVQFGGK